MAPATFTHHSPEPVTTYVTWGGVLKIGRLPWIIRGAQCHHEGPCKWRRELDKGLETRNGSTGRICSGRDGAASRVASPLEPTGATRSCRKLAARPAEARLRLPAHGVVRCRVCVVSVTRPVVVWCRAMEHHHEETRECLSHGAGTVRDTAKVLGDSTGGSWRLYWCQARGVDLCAYEVLCRRMDCEDSHKAAQPESRIPSARLVDWVRLRGHLRTPGRAGTPQQQQIQDNSPNLGSRHSEPVYVNIGGGP